ncbi:hypothetical protein TP49_13160 [Xanthomonas citri pv. aurantifolii]|nr:hypothetical protein TP49_13160 [Xanthomonas citri pv. aurantifolii]
MQMQMQMQMQMHAQDADFFEPRDHPIAATAGAPEDNRLVETEHACNELPIQSLHMMCGLLRWTRMTETHHGHVLVHPHPRR